MEFPDFLSKPVSYWNPDAESRELLGALAPMAGCPDTRHLPASHQEAALTLSFHTVDAQDLVSSLEISPFSLGAYLLYSDRFRDLCPSKPPSLTPVLL